MAPRESMFTMVCFGVAALTGSRALAITSPAASSAQSAAVATSIPRLVKFGGVVKDTAGTVRTEVVGMTFALYKEQVGGAALWLETQNVTLDAQGRYTVLLGSVTKEGIPMAAFASAELPPPSASGC